jgi:signal transduction histidine kinase
MAKPSVGRATRSIDQLKRAEALVRIAEQRNGEFLGILAYQLRNPLGPIRNRTKLAFAFPQVAAIERAEVPGNRRDGLCPEVT